VPVDQLASLGQGSAPGVGQVGAQGQQKAVEALSQAAGLIRAAMQFEPGLAILQPDFEKLTLKAAKYFGYEQEMKLAMTRAREQARAGGPPPMGPPGGPVGSGQGGPPPSTPPPM